MKTRRRPVLRIPDRLAVGVLVSLAASGCQTENGTDAAIDASGDLTTDANDAFVPDATNDLGDDGAIEDVASDSPTDVAPCDAQPYSRGTYQCVRRPGSDAGACSTMFVCSESMCGTDCVGCALNEATFTYGHACLADRDADANVECPPQVCTVGDCPSGCHTCTSTLFCIPDSTADVTVASCSPSVICADDPLGCQAGCRPVG